MSVRVKKSARRGVGGDCQRHHSHFNKRWNQPVVQRNNVIPHAAMRSILPQSNEYFLSSAFTPDSLARKLKVDDDDVHIQAEIPRDTSPVKLATDGGRPVKGDDEYQHWLKEFAWTRKAVRKSVVSLIQPGEELTLSRLVVHTPVMIHGIPVGNLRVKSLIQVHVPKSWMRIKEEHLKRAANSRAQVRNNVHSSAVYPDKVSDFVDTLLMQKAHAEPIIHQPLAEDIEAPPWLTGESANDAADHTVSAEQAAHADPPTKSEPLAERNGGFMEEVQLLRQTRQDLARAKHYRSSGFMHDVTIQRLGAHQYYERMKIVRDSGVNRRLSNTMYANRKAYYQYLFKHGDVCTHTAVTPRPLPDLKNSDSTRTAATPPSVKSASEEAFACMYHNYTNREFWNGPPQEVPAKPYRFPETAEIMSRAKQRIEREDAAAKAKADAVMTQDIEGADARYYRSWLRGHALRKESKFDWLLRSAVTSPVRHARLRDVWVRAREMKARSDIDAARLAWWVNAYQHRRHSTFDSVMRYAVIARLQPSKPVSIDLFSQCKNLMQIGWRAMNRSDYGTLPRTIAQMTKGMLLPTTHVTNRDPAMAQPRGKQ